MEKSVVYKVEKICYQILKYILSIFIGFLIARIGIKQSLSPFSLSFLAIVPFTKLNYIPLFFGSFIGYITKEFAIDNFKYICSNIIMLTIIILSGKRFYKKIYSPILPAVICFLVGFIFLFTNEISLVAVLLLFCESIICGCSSYFIKYCYKSIIKKSKLQGRDLISINITIIILICALDNYYILSTSTAIIFIILLVCMCSYFLETKTALLFTFSICAIPIVLHPDKSYYFLLLYIPTIVSLIISKYEKKHILTSYILSFYSVYTINFQNMNFGVALAPLYAAIIYIIIPKNKIEIILSDYITIKNVKQSNLDCDDLCKEYNKASTELLKKIENVNVIPLINSTIENKIKRYMRINKCKDISISNYYNTQGKQIITIYCRLEDNFSVKKLKNKICEICDCNFILNSQTIDENTMICNFEQSDNYKIECFALYKAKRGETICGDNVTAFKCPDGYYYLILADGMGSGKEAYNKSYNAITLTKKLLKSTSSLSNTIETVNGAIDLLKDGIGFSTMDICRISLCDATAEFVKCGATNSYVMRKNKIIQIKTGGFPLGLCDNVSYTSVPFQFEENDIIVMTSDGIILCVEKLQAIMIQRKSNNIETIAKAIVDISNIETETKSDDDMSIIVANIKKNSLV